MWSGGIICWACPSHLLSNISAAPFVPLCKYGVTDQKERFIDPPSSFSNWSTFVNGVRNIGLSNQQNIKPPIVSLEWQCPFQLMNLTLLNSNPYTNLPGIPFYSHFTSAILARPPIQSTEWNCKSNCSIQSLSKFG